MPAYPFPVAVLDSGLGGLTVAAALRRRLPNEDIIYFGDTARLPYGSKSPDTIIRFVREIITYLQQYRPKHVVIACNTATALALPTIRSEFPHLTITGVIEPGARAAIQAAGSRRTPIIGVIATEATVHSKAYEHAIFKRRHYAMLTVRATPLLVPIIEDGRDDGDPLVREALTQYLRPIAGLNPHVLLLGCTHYPIFKTCIARMMGPTCQVIDSAEQCAQDVADRLTVNGLASTRIEAGRLRCFVTDGPMKFKSLACRFLGDEIDRPVCVPIDELTAEPKLRMTLRQAV